MIGSRPWRAWPELPFAHGGPPVCGTIRRRPEDFQVQEILGFSPEGSGEHVLLEIRKTGANTEWVARRLAKLAGVPAQAIGYAGLKDRQAVTTQWFSIHLPGMSEPDWRALDDAEIQVQDIRRHRRKLRRGALRGNRFYLRVCDLAGNRDQLSLWLGRIREVGVPNYFGPQRFGNNFANLDKAELLFQGRPGRVSRHLRGIYLSAARSYLFNEVLACRVARGDWTRPLPGDRMQLNGSHASFLLDQVDEEIQARVKCCGIHPSGPLWGRGEPLTAGAIAQFEQEILAPFSAWLQGLENQGMRQERRPLRVRPSEFHWQLDEDLELNFTLPAGSYATALLRESVAVTSG